MSENEIKEEEVKIEETSPKPEDKAATVIEVPIPESEKDPSVEELDEEEFDKIKPNLAPDDEKITKLDEERKNYLIERAKEANIDFSTIKLGEDGYTPEISDEMVEVFASYSNGIFDKEFMQIFIDQATSIIGQYLDFKSMVDNGMIDEDDLEYYNGLGKSAEESRVVLALIQNEFNKIKKDFDENKVFELQSKAMTLSLLRDFFIEKFSLTDTLSLENQLNKVDISKYDRKEKLEKDIREMMFVSPIFREYVYRMCVLANVRKNKKPLSSEFFTDGLDELIFGINSYINNSYDKNDINVGEIIYKELNHLNFVKAVMTMMFLSNNDEFVKIDDTDEKRKNAIQTLKNKLDPNNIYTSASDNPFKSLYEKFTEIYNSINNKETLVAILNKMCSIVESDVTYKNLKKYYKLDIKQKYADVIKTISEHMPDVNGTSIVKWGKYYALLKKYELYHTCELVYKSMEENGKPEEIRANIIEMITSFMVEYMNIVNGKLISDIDSFVSENVYSKEMRPTMFGMIVNNILLQHELGFKSDISVENSSGDGLYALAEKVFGNQYKYIIIDKEKDYLLKEVNLTNTRKEYYSVVSLLFDLFKCGINAILH